MSGLIIGNGYLGKSFCRHFGWDIWNSKIESQEQINSILMTLRPTWVINCAGKTGRPNIDWCETHKEETFFSNVVLPSFIANACKASGANMVHIGSGCVYSGDHDGRGFSEDDEPNFDQSYYSWTKIVSERYLRDQDVLQIRIRMPFSENPNPRNLISKLIGYKKVICVNNSVTCIPDMFEAVSLLMQKNAKGIFNVVNEGAINAVHVLEAYSLASGSRLSYEVVSMDSLGSMTPRSNCILSTQKLRSFGINMRPVIDALGECMTEFVSRERERVS